MDPNKETTVWLSFGPCGLSVLAVLMAMLGGSLSLECLCALLIWATEKAQGQWTTHTHKHSEHDGSYKYLDRSSWHLALCFKIPFSGLGHSVFFPPSRCHLHFLPFLCLSYPPSSQLSWLVIGMPTFFSLVYVYTTHSISISFF